jgi:VanZ family protein
LNPPQLRYRRAWIAAIWMLVFAIVALSLMPQTGLKSLPLADKIGHLCAYFVLAVLGSAVVTESKLPRVMIWALALGLLIEGAQTLLTSSRRGEWADVLANTGGVAAAWILVRGRAGWAAPAEAWLARLLRH